MELFEGFWMLGLLLWGLGVIAGLGGFLYYQRRGTMNLAFYIPAVILVIAGTIVYFLNVR